jgi:hypothetical protein
LADSAQRLVLDALARAAMQPAGLPLFARAGAGLFTPTAAGKQAARHCRDDDLLRIVRHEVHGKTALEVCELTAKGLVYLLKWDEQHRALCAHLAAWHDGGALGDCPLPELFRRLHTDFPALTIGQFHDRIRLTHQGGRVHLHPWTGPLYEIPEPAYALLVGHEIAYYASLREPSPAALQTASASGCEEYP